MEKLIKFLVYKKNPLRQMGVVGFKAAHLEADPIKNRLILEQISKRFGPNYKMTNEQRTLAQFLCQESLYTNSAQKILSWLFFLFSIPVVLVFIFYKMFKKKSITNSDVIIFELGDLDYVKNDFYNKNIQTLSVGENTGNYLGFFELKFLFKTIKSIPEYLMHPRLLVNVLRWLSTYSWVVKYYNPKVIATFFEGTASVSLLTEYLHSKGIKHCNYAHGEHFRFECYSAYANFDSYVIWGEYFKKLQIEKHCRPEMFVTRAPHAFKQLYTDLRLLPKINTKQITVLIHSGVEKGQTEYNFLLSLLLKLEPGWSVVLRPHPVDRASWPEVFFDLKNDLNQKNSQLSVFSELPENISMKESVRNSRFFVGSASAALLEAFLAGCKIIYLPGRTKNIDIIERHQRSVNILYYDDQAKEDSLYQFLRSEYFIVAAEDKKINYLFALNDDSHSSK